MRPEEPACAPPWDGVTAPCPRWAAPAAPPRHRESIRSLHRTRGLVSVPFRVCPRASRARSSAAGARAGGSGLWAHGPPALPQFSDRLLCGRLSRVNTATPACFLPSRLPFSPASNSFWNCLVCREIAETEQEPPWPPTHTRHLSPHCRCLTGPVHWPSLCAAGSPVPSRGARQGRACPGDRGRPAWASGRWATCCLFSGASSGPGCLLSRPRQSLATGPSPEAPGRHLLPSACAWPLGAQVRASRRARPGPDQPPRGLPRLLVVRGTLLGPRSRPQCPLPRTPGWSSCEDTPPPARGCAWLHPAVLCLGVPSLVSLSHAGAELRLAWGSPLPGQGRAGSVSHGLALLAG